MKKTVALVMAIILSFALIIPEVVGISMIVRAEDMVEEDDQEPLQADSPDDGGDQEDPVQPDQPQPEDPQPVDPQVDPAPDPVIPPAPVVDPEEEARKKAEDEARKKAEEDAARAAEAEAAKKAQEQAAQEAIKRAEEELAAQEAAKKAAEEAAKEEKKKKEEEGKNYSISVSVGSSGSSSADFGTAPVGEQRDYKEIIVSNVGNVPVDLITRKNGDPDGAFSLSLHGDQTHLEPGQATRYNLSMSSNLSAGTYTALILFASNTDPGLDNARGLQVKGTVSSGQQGIYSVDVIPARIVLATGATAPFSADVRGIGQYDKTVRWSVTGNRSTGTGITADGDKGVLKVADDETSNSLTVMATSVQDPSVIGMSSVSLKTGSVNVNVFADPQRGGQVSGGGAVSRGGSVTVSAVPSANYYFEGWVRDGSVVSRSTNYTINNIQSDINITAKFSQQYVRVDVGVNTDNGGTVSGGGIIPYNGTTTISAKAYSGYVFTGWKENNTIVSRDASIKLKNLTVDRKFTAIFKQTTHTVTLYADPSDGGSVSGGGTFKLGESTTISARPNSNYTFNGWYVNDQAVSRDQDYKISKIEHDYSITAKFDKKGVTTYELSSGVATTGGSIAPCGKVYVAQGTGLTYTITPKAGFAILAVAVDGVQVGPVNSYTFSNIQGPHMIAAAFVQTDAGKKADEAAGKKTQDNKVQPLPKTESNTATKTSTISINEATTGEGGDNYVEEMDLDDIRIPSDEELGIPEVPEENAPDTRVADALGVSLTDVESMVNNGDLVPVLNAAFYSGVLGAYGKNDLQPKDMIGVDYENMSLDELKTVNEDLMNPSLTNYDVVVEKMFNKEEVMSIAQGSPADVSVSLTKTDPDPSAEKIMENAIGRKPVQFFDITMLKSAGGFTEKVNELPTTMEFVIEVPDEVYKSGENYSVLRVHEGTLAILPDLDDNPKTITFRTDRFSTYAIAEEVVKSNVLLNWLIAGVAIAFGVAVTCTIILIYHHSRMRRARVKA